MHSWMCQQAFKLAMCQCSGSSFVYLEVVLELVDVCASPVAEQSVWHLRLSALLALHVALHL